MATIDVLIVTALKEEHDAVRDAALAFPTGTGIAAWESMDGDTPTPYLVGTFIGADGRRMRLALARPTRMGATATAPIASALAERLGPRCLAMSGVCAGNPSAVVLGDVIIAEIVYTYDEGKRLADGFEPDLRPSPLRDTWVRAAQELLPDGLPSYGAASPEDARRWLLERLLLGEDPRKHPARARFLPGAAWRDLLRAMESEGLIRRDGTSLQLTEGGRDVAHQDSLFNVETPQRLPFALRVGPIASGNAVVKDGVTWGQLTRGGVRSVLGLEMEAAAIGDTARRLGIADWVVAKGVMDYADPRKDDRYKAFAARASAEVLFAFLLRQVATASAAVSDTSYSARAAYVIGGVSDETDYPSFEDAELRQTCLTIGQAVARAGATLIVCSPFPDAADVHAVLGYVGASTRGEVQFHSPRHGDVEAKRRELAALIGDTATRFVDYHYPGPEAPEGWGQAWLLCQIQALEFADVVIAVGGRVSKTANTLLHLAEARNIPVVPLAFLGGAARRAYERRDWARAHPDVDHALLQDKRRVDDVMQVANQLVLDRMGAQGRRGGVGRLERAFISRASPDAEVADRLMAFLQRSGVETILGDHVVAQQRLVQPAIRDALLQADVCIILWSAAYARSRWCYEELEFALQRNRVGELAVWLLNLDGSDVVPTDARQLPQAVVRSANALVEAVRQLVDGWPQAWPSRTR